jgi:hypothetical protein
MEYRTGTTADIWSYRDQNLVGAGTDLAGFSVEAVDGGIGKVDEASADVGRSYIVVDTGPWIFGKKVLLPAGVIDRVDLDASTVYVNRSKDEIKNAPEFDEATYREDAYRESVGSYYGGPGTTGTTGSAGTTRTDDTAAF